MEVYIWDFKIFIMTIYSVFIDIISIIINIINSIIKYFCDISSIDKNMVKYFYLSYI